MKARLASFGIAAAVVLLDRVTKAWIDAKVSLAETWVVIPGFFNIVHTRNRGAAFGLFSEAESGWPAFMLALVSAGVLVLVAGLLWRFPRQAPAGHENSRVALSLVLGGALGNLYDRLLHGSVTDFLDFYVGNHHWPAFNVADSAITVGAALLALDLLRSHQRSRRA